MKGHAIKLYREIVCPHFTADELCGIYENRYSCCRNFPNRQTGMFCASTTRCIYDVDGNLDCKNCLDKCCRHIWVGADKEFDPSVLKMDCLTCSETYKS